MFSFKMTRSYNKKLTRLQFAKYWILRGIMTSMLSVTGSAVVMAMLPQRPELSVPQITTTTDQEPAPARVQSNVGKVVLAELATSDIKAAKKFYGKLFHWTFRDIPGTKYTQVFLGQRQIAGLVEVRGKPSEWVSLFAVGDVDATKVAVPQYGGKIFSGSHEVPDRGRATLMADPQGAVFGILPTKEGDFEEIDRLPGEWIWRSLITGDARNNANFYKDLFHLELFALKGNGSRPHLVLASDNYAMASINSMSEGGSSVNPFWLNYVRVQNAESVVKKVVEHKGQIIVNAQSDDHGGKVAIVADPGGALFGLLELPGQKN